MSKLSLQNINKIYPNNVQAVFDFNLEIAERDFIVLVGPSGCGKSTTLRMIAGLESITSGNMLLNGTRINDKAPADRDIAMIFQDYALYGNMSVYENMGFSLIVRKADPDQMHDAIMKTSKVVNLEEQLNRMPKNLSGGQRQRVALGRSIVRNAEVFLMDEPLSNLDAKLRVHTRKEIVKLHNRLNATIVYVTHDQIEAMTMATKIVVMNEGYIQHVGSPYDVYNSPNNMFVASFIGSPPMNLIRGKIEQNYFIGKNLKLEIPISKQSMLSKFQNKPIVIGIRPELFNIAKKEDTTSHITFDIQVDLAELLGSVTIVRFVTENQSLTASISAGTTIHIGDKLTFTVDMEGVHFFDPETELRLREE